MVLLEVDVNEQKIKFVKCNIDIKYRKYPLRNFI